MSVVIKVGSKRSTITGDFPKDDIDFATSAYVNGYQFAPTFRRKRADGSRIWDGKIHLFSRVSNTFATGVIDIVCEILDHDKVKYTLEYPENEIEDQQWVIPDTCGEYVLYDYQKEACAEFFKKRILPYRGVIKIGTGGGKTVCGATIARIVKGKTLFLVHGKKLTRQNHEVFQRVFKGQIQDIGIIDAKRWEPNLITIASSDTLYARMKNLDYEDKLKELFDGVVLVIVDECHRSTSKSFSEILKTVNAPMRLGLSGTPNKKEDDRDLLLHSLTGPIVFGMGVKGLKEAGAVSKAHLVSVIVNQPVLREDLDWHEAYESLVVNNVYRHELISKLVAKRANDNKTILVLAGNSISLADQLYTWVTKLVDPVEVKLVNGLSGDKVVDSAFKDLQDKKIKVVITTTIADEGLDIPAINSLFNVGGGASFVKTVQRVGRVLRLKDDGSHAEIVDILDNTNGYLRKHAKARLNWYEEEELFDTTELLKAEDVMK